MKKLFYILLACTAFACSDRSVVEKTDIDIDFNVFPKKWVLVQMSGNMSNSTTTGTNMAWQEYYVFNEDNTFVKVRTQTGKETQAAGTYSVLTVNEENQLVLTYTTESDLIGSCTGSLSESLWLKSPGKMSSNWLQCDGPGLDYERVE